MTNPIAYLENETLLTRQQLAEKLGCTPQHLENLATRGDGPEFIKVGRLVRYRLSSVDRWLNARTVTSTTAARRLRGNSVRVVQS